MHDPGIRGPWPLVGRGEELDLLRTLIGGRRAGGVVLAGAAGTGKSRLAREAGLLAEKDGRSVMTLIATEATASIPFGVLLPLLPVPEPDAPLERRLAQGMTVLKAAGTDHVLVVIVDDAQLLDESSAALLQRAVLADLVFLVATVRTAEGPPPWITALWKDLHAERIEVQPLSRPETHKVLAGALGGDLDGSGARILWESTLGNPLYLRELLVAAVLDGTLREETGVWRLVGRPRAPRSLTELINHRIQPLPATARTALELLAWAETIGLDELEVLGGDGTVDELERHGVVEVFLDGRRRQTRLVHPIYGEVVRSSTRFTRQMQIVAALASRVELHGARRRDDLLRIAGWRLATGSIEPTLAVAAARQAYSGGSFDLSERLCRAALDSEPETEAMLLLGQILHEKGEHDSADKVNRELAGMDLDGSGRRRLAVQRAVNLFFGLGWGDQAMAALVPDGALDIEDQVMLRVNRAWLELNMGRLDRAAITISSTSTAGDPEPTLAREVASAWIDVLSGRPRSARKTVDALARCSEDRPRPDLGRFRDFPELPYSMALIEEGELDEAETLMSEANNEAVTRHPVFIQAWWQFLLGRLRLDQGRPVDAASHFRRGAALQTKMSQPGLLRWHLGGLALAQSQTAGGIEDAIDTVARCESIGDRVERLFVPLLIQAQAWILLSRGSRTEAIELLIRESGQLAEAGSHMLQARLLHDVVRMGGARQVADTLTSLPIDDNPLSLARRNHALGMAGEDRRLIAEAATGFETLGLCLVAAETWNSAAAGHTRAGESRRAGECRRRAHELMRRCPGAHTPGLAAAEEFIPLTDREREVVVLAAGGMPSREIASHLYVSVRTVNNLLQRAYTKLGVSGRAAAAAALGIRRQ